MYCMYCSSAIDGNAQFCSVCGTRQESVVPLTGAKAAPKKSGNVLDWMGRHPIWTIIILLFVVGQLSRVLLTNDQSTRPTTPEDTATEDQRRTEAAEKFNSMTPAEHLAAAKNLQKNEATRAELEE